MLKIFQPIQNKANKVRNIFQRETGLFLSSILLILLKFVFPDSIKYLANGYLAQFFMIFVTFSVMLFCAFNIIKHAHHIAEQLGEPQGTLILTLSVVTIEVGMIISLSIAGEAHDPCIIRDTCFAVIMLAINGFCGLSLLTGALKHNRQSYNLQSASSYLALLTFLATSFLILPNYTKTVPGSFSEKQSILMVLISYLLYIMFLVKQIFTHSDYFRIEQEEVTGINVGGVETTFFRNLNMIMYSIFCLFIGLFLMINLSEYFGEYVKYTISYLGLPKKLTGFIIAALVLAPEGVSAVQAAYENRLQRSLNLCLGSAIATTSITLPTVLMLNLVFLRQPVILGIGAIEEIMLILTFFSSFIVFSSRKTSPIYGMTMLGIIITYIMMLIDAA